MKLTKTIFLYLNEKEFSMLTKDAERANMSMSRYIRHQIDNAKMKPTLDMDYEKYINLLEPICDKLSIVSKRVWQIKMLDTVRLRPMRWWRLRKPCPLVWLWSSLKSKPAPQHINTERIPRSEHKCLKKESLL